MEATLRKVEKYKKEIANAKQEKAEAEGAVKTNTERLKSEFSVKTLNEAKRKREDLLKRRDSINEKITETMEVLEETYEL